MQLDFYVSNLEMSQRLQLATLAPATLTGMARRERGRASQRL
jgi:hypothetical protein